MISGRVMKGLPIVLPFVAAGSIPALSLHNSETL
jgi:hypothetical protein